MQYLARCHCGSLAAHYRTEQPPREWPLRACQCSFCRAHAALSTSDPQGLLEFAAATPSRVQRYRFASRSAEFLLCRECGIYLGARMMLDGGRWGILNVRALDVAIEDLPAPVPMDYGRESRAERQSRRAARWTPLVATSL